jgi:diguanylate cyclase (GGDEF)-like protein/PAS domain S-box-containing protein
MLGLSLALPPGYASPIFPPAGIAVAATFIGGKKSLPGIFIASLLLNLWVDYSSGREITAAGTEAALVIAFASMLQAAAGGWVLRRVFGYPALFDNRRDILHFLLLVPVICLTSATLSVSGLWALGLVESTSFLSNWASWWLGDSFGVIVLFPLTMMVAGEPRDLWRIRIRTIAYPMVVVLTVGLGAIYFLQNAAFNTARQLQQENFDYQTREIVLRIEQRLRIYEQALRSVKGLYLASKQVERGEFQSYVNSLGLEKHYPGMQGLGFSLAISPNEKAAHIAAIREQGLVDYDIHPKGDREFYTTIVYLEPFSGSNLGAIGYDMFSERTRRAAMEQARDHDMSALSGKVQLLQDIGSNRLSGCLMYLPVYQPGSKHYTPELREAHIHGWVYAAFNMNDLMEGILGEQVNNIDLAIYDGLQIHDEALMFHSRPASASSQPLFHSTQYVKIAGRDWAIRLQSLPAFDAGIDTGKVAVIRLSGILLMLLLSMLVWQLAFGRAQAVKWAEDMTSELRKNEKQLKQALKEIEDLYNNAPCGYHSLDKDGMIRRINDTELTWLGYTRDEVVGRMKWADLVSPESKKAFEENFPIFIRRGYLSDMEFDVIRKDGTVFTGLIHATAIYDAEGNYLMSRSTLFDITDRKHSERVIQNLAFYDSLTQLANRRLLNDRLYQAMAASNRSGLYGALMFLDLDNFKPLNDNYGHHVGDLLLIEVANRIKSCVRATDTVSRFGGDEFVVLLSELDADEKESTQLAKLLAEKLRIKLAEPYILAAPMADSSPVQHHSTCSIGVTLFVNNQDTVDEIIKRADQAMYEAKESGRNQIRVNK